MWVQHGGSGYGGLSRADVLDMTADEVEWHVKRVSEQRKTEARALESAYRKK
jgi:hypothetical protein